MPNKISNHEVNVRRCRETDKTVKRKEKKHSSGSPIQSYLMAIAPFLYLKNPFKSNMILNPNQHGGGTLCPQHVKTFNNSKKAPTNQP